MLHRPDQKPLWPLLVLAAYAMLILLGTHSPTDTVPNLFSAHDKALHLVCYALLACLAFFAARSQGWVTATGLSAAAKVVAATCLFGAVDELTQSFVPGRLVDPFDFVANFIGCLIGASVFLIVLRARQCREKYREIS